jgi:hypothetical protein
MLTTPAVAGFSVANESGYRDFSVPFEARIRLDGGTIQDWKLAFYADETYYPGPGVTDVFAKDVAYPFTLTYNSETGAASLVCAGLGISNVMELTPEWDLVAFELRARSEPGFGTTSVTNLRASADGAPFDTLPGVTSELDDVAVDGPRIYASEAVGEITISGDLTFTWLDGASLDSLNFHLRIKIVDGDPTTVATEGTTWSGVKSLFD